VTAIRGPLSALALLCVVLAAERPAEALDLEELLSHGAELEASGQLDDAVAAYGIAVVTNDKAPIPHVRRASVLKQQKKCAEAVTDYEAYARLSPATDRHGPTWDDAMLALASCRRELRASLELRPDRDARCRVDGGAAKDVPSAAGLTLELDAGTHQLQCASDGIPWLRSVTLTQSEHRVLPLAFASPGAIEPPPADDGTRKVIDPSALPPKPAESPPPIPEPRAIELSLGGGFGAARGAFGVAAGVRFGPIGLMVGTGYYPVGAEVTWFAAQGKTGFYLSAGYLRIANTFWGGLTIEAGHEFYGVGGVDVRPIPHLSIRVGVGAGYLTTQQNAGPLTFDAAAFWVP
jgi:hypothetical protein